MAKNNTSNTNNNNNSNKAGNFNTTMGQLPSLGVKPRQNFTDPSQVNTPEWSGNPQVEQLYQRFDGDPEAYRRYRDQQMKSNRYDVSFDAPSVQEFQNYGNYMQKQQEAQQQKDRLEQQQDQYNKEMQQYDKQKKKLINKVKPQLEDAGLGYLSGTLGNLDGAQLTQALGLIQDYQKKQEDVNKLNERNQEAEKELLRGFEGLQEGMDEASQYVRDSDTTQQMQDALKQYGERTEGFRSSIDESLETSRQQMGEGQEDFQQDIGTAKDMLEGVADTSFYKDMADRVADINVPDPTEINPELDSLYENTRDQIKQAEKIVSANTSKIEDAAEQAYDRSQQQWDTAKSEQANMASHDMLVARQSLDKQFKEQKKEAIARSKDGDWGSLQRVSRINKAHRQSLNDALSKTLSANQKLRTQLNRSAAESMTQAAYQTGKMKENSYSRGATLRSNLAQIQAKNNMERASQHMAVEQMKASSAELLGNLYNKAAQINLGGEQLKTQAASAYGDLSLSEYQQKIDKIAKLYQMELSGQQAKQQAGQSEAEMQLQGQQARSQQLREIGNMLQNIGTTEFSAQMQLQDLITNMPIYSAEAGSITGAFTQLMENQRRSELQGMAEQLAEKQLKDQLQEELYPQEENNPGGGSFTVSRGQGDTYNESLPSSGGVGYTGYPGQVVNNEGLGERIRAEQQARNAHTEPLPAQRHDIRRT